MNECSENFKNISKLSSFWRIKCTTLKMVAILYDKNEKDMFICWDIWKKDPKNRKKSFNPFNLHTCFEYNTKYKGILVTHYCIDDLSKTHLNY